MKKKSTIYILLIIILIIGIAFLTWKLITLEETGNEILETNGEEENNIVNNNVNNEVQDNNQIENNIQDKVNDIEKKEETNLEQEDDEFEEENKKETEEIGKETIETEAQRKEKAIEIVKKDWGDSNSSSIGYDSMSGKQYLISVKQDGRVVCWYYVDIETETFEKEWVY